MYHSLVNKKSTLVALVMSLFMGTMLSMEEQRGYKRSFEESANITGKRSKTDAQSAVEESSAMVYVTTAYKKTFPLALDVAMESATLENFIQQIREDDPQAEDFFINLVNTPRVTDQLFAYVQAILEVIHRVQSTNQMLATLDEVYYVHNNDNALEQELRKIIGSFKLTDNEYKELLDVLYYFDMPALRDFDLESFNNTQTYDYATDPSVNDPVFYLLDNENQWYAIEKSKLTEFPYFKLALSAGLSESVNNCFATRLSGNDVLFFIGLLNTWQTSTSLLHDVLSICKQYRQLPDQNVIEQIKEDAKKAMVEYVETNINENSDVTALLNAFRQWELLFFEEALLKVISTNDDQEMLHAFQQEFPADYYKVLFTEQVIQKNNIGYLLNWFMQYLHNFMYATDTVGVEKIPAEHIASILTRFKNCVESDPAMINEATHYASDALNIYNFMCATDTVGVEKIPAEHIASILTKFKYFMENNPAMINEATHHASDALNIYNFMCAIDSMGVEKISYEDIASILTKFKNCVESDPAMINEATHYASDALNIYNFMYATDTVGVEKISCEDIASILAKFINCMKNDPEMIKEAARHASDALNMLMYNHHKLVQHFKDTPAILASLKNIFHMILETKHSIFFQPFIKPISIAADADLKLIGNLSRNRFALLSSRQIRSADAHSTIFLVDLFGVIQKISLPRKITEAFILNDTTIIMQAVDGELYKLAVNETGKLKETHIQRKESDTYFRLLGAGNNCYVMHSKVERAVSVVDYNDDRKKTKFVGGTYYNHAVVLPNNKIVLAGENGCLYGIDTNNNSYECLYNGQDAQEDFAEAIIQGLWNMALPPITSLVALNDDEVVCGYRSGLIVRCNVNGAITVIQAEDSAADELARDRMFPTKISAILPYNSGRKAAMVVPGQMLSDLGLSAQYELWDLIAPAKMYESGYSLGLLMGVSGGISLTYYKTHSDVSVVFNPQFASFADLYAFMNQNNIRF